MDKIVKRQILPMMALRGIVVFPYMVLHFDVSRKKSIKALEDSMLNDQLIFLVAQKDDVVENPKEADLYKTGTVSKVKQVVKLPGDVVGVLVEGLYRANIVDIVEEEPFFMTEIEKVDTVELEYSLEMEALVRILKDRFEDYFSTNTRLSPDVIMSVMSMSDPEQISDIIVANTSMQNKDKQMVLSVFDLKDRIELLITLLTKETEILRVEREIALKVKEKLDKNQKEYYLREQLKIIQDELGDKEGLKGEIAEYTKKMNEIKAPKEVVAKLQKEFDRLLKMPQGTPEGSMIRNYIDCVLELPWSKKTKERFDINKAEQILERDHYGLEKVKGRILEYLAVRKLKKGGKSPILCLVGPPGVGKTSIAKSVAESLGRKYVRISLGGVRDESEIRGHRRTYIGSMPGRIIAAIRQGGSKNPLMLFDEIDKMSSDLRGDPASAMLEVLDPEQNVAFRDHYLELNFDLSDVLFITTANALDTIPRPLLDRMEVMEISGYTDDEKLNIAKRYLIPKQIENNGLNSINVVVEDEAINDIITYYTKEAGVRNLEREIGSLCRKIAKDSMTHKFKSVTVTRKVLLKYIGKRRFRFDLASEVDQIGVSRGLAWTSVGGDTLSIEVNIMDGSGKIELTGKLGDVMKESAMAAISYIRSRVGELGINPEFHKISDIHIHVPEGAVPKDGPSAGITIATALVSALTNRAVKKDVAMTGEITLRGRVLAIGGLKEKSIAAYKAGIKTIIIPLDNQKDLEDIPLIVRENVKFVPVEHMDKVLATALVKKGNTTNKYSIDNIVNDRTSEDYITSRPTI